MYIYIYIYILYVRTLRKQVLQLHKLDGCTLHRMAYIYLLQHSMLFSGFRCSVAFLPQVFCNQSIGFRRSRCTHSPTLLCTGAMHSGQLFSILIVRRFTLGAPQLQICSTTLCWCMKYLSKDNLPLPLLARKWDNRQSNGETIGKAT